MLPCVFWLQLVLILLSRGENCPVTCLCPDPHTVDCSGRGLTRLPDEIPLDVRRLLLADNWIPRIPSDFLVLYSDLVYLDLRNNSLSHIEQGTLSTTSRLVFLDLGSNNLTEIPKGTFGESRSLIKLRLGNNPYLSMVNEEAFLGLTSLRELELERNALSTLKVGALSQLPSLRVVRLEGNPWVCNCNFANLFAWLMENSHKLPNGVEGMECSLPMDGRRVSLTQLSKDSFRECQASLTLTDLLIIIFSGISVSVVAIMTSFFLASTVHCFQRWSKGTKGDEEESEEWEGRGGGLLRSLVPGNSDGCEDFTAGGGSVHNCHTASALWSIQDCLTVGSCPHTVTFFFCTRTSQVRRRRTFQRNELQLQSTQIILFLCFWGAV